MATIGQIQLTNLNVQNTGAGEAYNASVYITLTDATTGAPVNGNNLVAYYIRYDSDFVNNTSTAGQVVAVQIPGQSVKIYDGVIERVDESGTPLNSTTFIVTKVSGSVDPNPLFALCNLVIRYINIDKPETAPGANDAQITVTAETSWPAIYYSLDGANFQSSNVFTGLSGGLKTVYVKDSSTMGCTAQLSITIPVLTNLLLSDPSVNIGTNTNPNFSRWNAAFNPVTFTYQRQDYQVLAVAEEPVTGNAMVSVNADTSAVLAGDMVYLNAGPYNGVFTVNGASGNQLTLDLAYAGAAAGGFININRLRPYYQLQTLIKYQDPITNQSTTITSVNRPDGTGLVKADISNFLQSILRVKDDSDYTQINFRDDNLSASYQVSYVEKWDGYTTEQPTVLANTYYVIYAAKQLSQQYGGNLAAYVPFKVPSPNVPLAKWITDFAEPAYSPGYPFDIGFIYSEDLAGLNVYAVITQLDINRNPLGPAVQVNLLNEDGSFLLNEDSSKLIIQRGSTGIVPVAQHVGLNRLLFTGSGLLDDAWYYTVDLRYKDGGAQTAFQYSLSEAVAPYIDGNILIQDSANGSPVAAIYSSTDSSANNVVNMAAGRSFSIVANCQQPTTAGNPKLNMTITRNGTTVFAQTIAATQGASMAYSGTTGDGIIFDITVTTTDGTDDLTPVNVADTTVVTGMEVQIMQTQTIRIDKSPDYNSVYLRWIGLTGSWNYYRFIYNQEVSLDVQNATIIKNYVSDWENQDSIEEVIGKSAGQKVKVMAEDLSVEDIKGLQSIKYSPKVQMLISTTPIKWQTIVINTATFSEYETLNGQAPFSITFNQPSINIQTQ